MERKNIKRITKRVLLGGLALLSFNFAVYFWWWSSLTKNASWKPLVAASVSLPVTSLVFWRWAGLQHLKLVHTRRYKALQWTVVWIGLLSTLFGWTASIAVGKTAGCEWCGLILMVGIVASPIAAVHLATLVGLAGAASWVVWLSLRDKRTSS